MADVVNAVVLLANFVLVPAAAYGCQLALGALGVTLVYGVLRFSNFAHGETMAFGAMVTILVTWLLQSWGVGIAPLPTALLALPAGIVATGGLCLLTDRWVYRFYRRKKAAPVILLVASVGIMFVLNGLIRFVIGPDDQVFTDGTRFVVSVRQFKAATGLAEGLAIKTTQTITAAVTVILVLWLFWFLGRTRTGKSMRAYSDNEDLALLSGINPERVVAVTWVIVGALAAVAGTLYGLDKSFKPFTFSVAPAANLRRRHRRRSGQSARRHHGGLRGGILGGAAHLPLQEVPGLSGTGRLAAGRPGPVALHRLQVRGVVLHPGRGAAGEAHRHLRQQIRMSDRFGAGMARIPRKPVLFAVMAALVCLVGLVQSWSLALAILNLCLISAIMTLGVNIQWGYAGLFNAGVMGFAALGGLAGVLVSMPPVTAAWRAGGAGVLVALALATLTVLAVFFVRRRLGNPWYRRLAVACLLIGGTLGARAVFAPAVRAIESVDPTVTGYLGGLGLPIVLSWLVGGAFAAAAAWVCKISLTLRSDYLAIATWASPRSSSHSSSTRSG